MSAFVDFIKVSNVRAGNAHWNVWYIGETG